MGGHALKTEYKMAAVAHGWKHVKTDFKMAAVKHMGRDMYKLQ